MGGGEGDEGAGRGGGSSGRVICQRGGWTAERKRGGLVAGEVEEWGEWWQEEAVGGGGGAGGGGDGVGGREVYGGKGWVCRWGGSVDSKSARG